jgi:hypothetical protein
MKLAVFNPLGPLGLMLAARSFGADTGTVAGSYKTVYEGFVAEQVMNRFPLKDYFKWEQLDHPGQEVVYNAHTSRNISPMFVGEDGAFADAGNQGSIKIHVGQRKMMARVRITSEAMHDSTKSEAAWTSTRKDEMTRIIDDMARMEEYALSSDGRGVLALINEATPSGNTTLILDSPGGITGADFGNRFLLAGMYIGAVNPVTGALRAGIVKIVSCADDGTSVTVDAAPNAAWADNDYIVQVANSAVTDVLDTSYEHGFWGMTALFDDGTYRTNYFNADRDLYPQFKAYVGAATGPISADLLQRVADVQDQRMGGRTRGLMGHHSVRRTYLSLTEADRRYTNANLQKPDAGTVAFLQEDLTVGTVPFKAIRTAPLAMLFGIDTDSGLVCYGSEKGKWVDEDGSVLVRVGSGSSGRDAFEAWYRKRQQYHVRYPGKNWRLDGITGQTLVVVREAGS